MITPLILSKEKLEDFVPQKLLPAKITDFITLIGSHDHSDYMTTTHKNGRVYSVFGRWNI